MIRGMEGARRDAVVEGRRHRARFDLAYGDGAPRLAHFVDLGDAEALKSAKLLDWAASDVVDAGAYSEDSLLLVLACEGGARPAGAEARGRNDVTMRILGKYPVRDLDTGGDPGVGINRIFYD